MKKSATPNWIPLEEAVPVDLFKADVQSWARRMEVTLREIRLRTLKCKWSSCSSRVRFTFDIELIRQPAAFRWDVIVHELLHLKVPNHGPLFKTLLRAYLALHREPHAFVGESTP